MMEEREIQERLNRYQEKLEVAEYRRQQLLEKERERI
jgi:hypothetical protein